MRTDGPHTRVTVAGAVLLLLSGLTAGCLERRDEPETSDNSCTSCHGSDEREGGRLRQAAPPVDIDGNTGTRSRGVGAHQRHLTASATHTPVACDECHVVPEETFSDGHVDSDPPAEITFGELARTGDRAPSYSARDQSCSDTYCHRDSDPDWTRPRNSEDACGSCHGLPPPLPHAQSENCFECHADVIDEEMAFVAPELHVNGTVEAAGGCSACHGSDDSPAPPRDLQGNTEATSPGVGAHQAHLVDRGITRPVECQECHVVPTRADDEGHLDDTPGAELTFSGVATTGGATPSFDAETLTCTGAWCHGPSAPDDSVSPEWTAALGGLGCTDCHGLPPPSPHPQNHDCEECHGGVIDAGLQFLASDRHVNGTVDVDATLVCNSCHGSADSNAPPQDLLGNTDPTSPGVGAHQAHLTGANGSRPLGCDECHSVPTEVDDAGHLDASEGAEVVFTGVAATGGAEGAYDATSGTCSGTWCHGPADPAGSTSPEWTIAGPLDCDACHGFPPPAPHPDTTDCWQCHDGVDSDLAFAEPSLHVDGNIDLLVDCNSCHGSDTSDAPPVDLLGNSDSSSRGVGAHQTHLGATNARALACNECHTVPADRDDPGHLDDTEGAELQLTGIATTGGNSVSYDADTLTCSGTWCHGPSDPAGSTSPEWTSSDGLGCGDCHGFPPPPPHVAAADCWLCHDGVNSSLSFSDPSTHVNGSVDLLGDCNVCHGSADSDAPPVDLLGNTDPTSPGVGAHQAHLGATNARAVACSECHTVPTDRDDPGHLDTTAGAELNFTGVATTGGNTVTYDATALTCTGTWCHGPSDPSNSVSPEWNSASSLGCTDCHGFPPPAPHPNSSACWVCHDNVDASYAFVDASLHVNGSVEVNSGCNGCHGSAGSNAPPIDLLGNTDSTSAGVGAHQAHLTGSGLGRTLACSECHVVPAAVDDTGHLDSTDGAELDFSGVATTGGNTVAYDNTALTCSGTWCHGPSNPSGSVSPEWTTSGPLGCTDCHGFPPPTPHPDYVDCYLCHANIDDTYTFADPALHVNGAVDLSGACNTCHGSASSNAPPVDLSGNTDPTTPGVGAHQAHLSPETPSRAVQCDDCHTVPAAVDDPGHLDAVAGAELSFSAVAEGPDGGTVVYDAGTGTCTGTWCHGPSDAAASLSPVWTTPRAFSCMTCHGLPPAAPHPAVAANSCPTCHTNVTDAFQFVDPNLHINGAVDF